MDNELTVEQAFQGLGSYTPLQLRYRICQFQYAMEQALARGELQERDFEVTHSFHEGKYLRGIFLPAGSVLVGKLHKYEHPSTIWSGRVTVVTEQFGREEITGPWRGVSPAATKRLILVHEDTIWSVEHETELTDLDEIEAAVIAKSYTQLGLEDPMEQLKVKGN